MEYMPDFKVHRPETIEDAVKLYALEDNARFLAGGTDIVVNIRRGIEVPDALVDLTAVAELKSIRQDADGIHIGAAVPLQEVALHEALGSGHGLAVALATLGQILVQLGDLERAEQILTRTLDVRSSVQFKETTGAVFDTLAHDGADE